jgi:O-antigen/teichoic acid export membrane protein
MASAPPVLEEPVLEAPRAPGAGGSATRKQIRGSSLFLGGRMISLGLNFLTQVLIVRYLTKSDFGAFAYGLSLVSLGEYVAGLGLDKAVGRFLPIYDERGEHGKLLGTLVMVAASVISIGLAMLLLAIGLHGFASGQTASGTELAVVLTLMILSPVQALDGVLMGTFAVFSRPTAIFFRKYVVAPGLQLSAIGLVMLSGSGVRDLAIGYVVAGGLGLALYVVMLVQMLRAKGLLTHLRRQRLSFPVREVYGFAIPLISVDLLFVVMNTVNIWMLQHFGTAADVADYRVVQPAAKLNLLVMTSFTLLFTPLASRLFARGDREGIQELYWRTAIWMAIFSFPVFALTSVDAHPLTVALFGERYAGSAPIMALLAIGYYFNAALGFNGLTLRVFGLVRYSVVISLAAAAANVALNLALIPAYGAIGAGVGTAATLVLHNLLKQAGLRKGTGISILERDHLRVYGVVVAAACLLLAITIAVHPGFVASLVLVGVASAAVMALTRSSLHLGDTFPELLRVPLLRRLAR